MRKPVTQKQKKSFAIYKSAQEKQLKIIQKSGQINMVSSGIKDLEGSAPGRYPRQQCSGAENWEAPAPKRAGEGAGKGDNITGSMVTWTRCLHCVAKGCISSVTPLLREEGNGWYEGAHRESLSGHLFALLASTVELSLLRKWRKVGGRGPLDLWFPQQAFPSL